MMYKWLVRGAHRLELPGARPRADHVSGRAVHDYASRHWLTAFLDHWLGRVPAAQTAI
jgi:GMP synthase (glutamine-hydrolysing)